MQTLVAALRSARGDSLGHKHPETGVMRNDEYTFREDTQ